jgi:formylglycine-generating enzyme required for sulfatase activity
MKAKQFTLVLFFTLWCFHASILSALSTSGLVAWYPFNADAGDASGNGHNGLVYGADLCADRFGNSDKAYGFNSSQHDYIRVPDHPDLRISEAITIALWIKHSAAAGGFEDIVMKGNDSYGFQFNNGSDEVLFHLASNGWRNLNSYHTPNPDEWFHIAGTYDGTTQRVYVNGLETNSTQFSGTIQINQEPLDFGYMVAGDNSWYNGQLDDCCIYNRALSPAEIQDLYYAGLNVIVLSPPANLQITGTADNLQLTWDPVSGANQYIVSSSTEPYGQFSQDNNGTFLGTSWTAPATEDMLFYRVSSVSAYTGLHPNLVLVEGGTFNNGTSDITISDFYVEKYEVTQSQYQALMGENPSISLYGLGDNYPVYYVSWYKVLAYCNLRSIQEGLTPCYSYYWMGTNPADWPTEWSVDNHNLMYCNWDADGYRLPTEMEWMFAAKGGNLSNDYTYAGSNTISGVAWYYNNSGNAAHPIGTKSANELGLYDMSGNVRKWVWDKYGAYSVSNETNPTGALSSNTRVQRGGSFALGQAYCTISSRLSDYPANGTYDLGFRVCRRGYGY